MLKRVNLYITIALMGSLISCAQRKFQAVQVVQKTPEISKLPVDEKQSDIPQFSDDFLFDKPLTSKDYLPKTTPPNTTTQPVDDTPVDNTTVASDEDSDESGDASDIIIKKDANKQATNNPSKSDKKPDTNPTPTESAKTSVAKPPVAKAPEKEQKPKYSKQNPPKTIDATQEDSVPTGKAPDNRFLNPIDEDPLRVSYFYGPRVFSTYGRGFSMRQLLAMLKPTSKKAHHSGVDMPVPSGTNVFATHDGVVAFAGNDTCTGRTVVLAHKIGEELIYSAYMHLSSFRKVLVGDNGYAKLQDINTEVSESSKVRTLKAGDKVKIGQVIAKSGATGSPAVFKSEYVNGAVVKRKIGGCVSGAHLHFEIRQPKTGGLSEATRFSDMHQVYAQTTDVNPANYVIKIDNTCKTKKVKELEAAVSQNSDKITITTGFCSDRSEQQIEAMAK